MKPYKQFKSFQIRWKESLGLKESPYLYRWTFIFFGYSIRIHHWIKSDDNRYLHDHSCNLISIVLKGEYYNHIETRDNVIQTFETKRFIPKVMKATQRHWLQIPKDGAWTLLLCGKPYHKWGFYIDNKKVRPLKYFYKYGIIQTKDYQ